MSNDNTFVWALFLKPFVFFVLMVSAALLAKLILAALPDGRVKRVLTVRFGDASVPGGEKQIPGVYDSTGNLTKPQSGRG